MIKWKSILVISIVFFGCMEDDSENYFPFDQVPGKYTGTICLDTTQRNYFHSSSCIYCTVFYVYRVGGHFTLDINEGIASLEVGFVKPIAFSVVKMEVIESYFTSYVGIIRVGSSNYELPPNTSNYIQCAVEHGEWSSHLNMTVILKDSVMFDITGKK